MRKKQTYFYSLLLTALFLLPWSGMKADDQTLTLYGTGTTSNYFVPVYGSYLDENQHSQLIFPASDLEDLKGNVIKGLKFHLKNTGTWSGSGSQPIVVVSLAEVEQATLSELNTAATLQQVFSGSFNIANNEWTITFPSDKYYTYGDKNLLVDIVSTAGGKYILTSWYVKAVTDAAYTYSAKRSYLPRTTFTYDEAPASSCPKPTDITPASIDATSASFTWTKGGDESSWQYICLPAGTAVDWSDATVETAITTAANISGLDPNTAYKFYVRAYCGGGEGEQSSEVSLAFTTDKSCYEPASVAVSEITANSATATWTESGHGETQWQYAIVEGSAAPSSWSSATTSKSYTFTGLTPITSYKVWVRSHCGAEDESEAVSASFTTECGTATGIGWSQNFDSETAYPACWKSLGGTPTVSSSSWYVHSGKGLYYYGGTSNMFVILPEFTEIANETKTLQLNFWYSNYSSTYTGDTYPSPTVGWITDPTDANTFHAVETLAKVDSWTQANVALVDAPPGSLVAICYGGGSSSGYLLMDDFSVSEAPSCIKPTGVSGSSTAYNQASISWTSSASAWKLQYSADGGTNWTDANSGNNIMANPYTLNNLEGNTSYIVRVKADCGGGDASDWSVNSAAFTTPCGPQSVSDWSENFENTTAGSGKLPDCWVAKQTRTYSSTIYPCVQSSGGNTNPKALYFYGGSTTTVNTVVLPPLDGQINTLTIEFYYKASVSSSYTIYGNPILGYIAADGTTFEEIETIAQSASYTQYKKDLSLAALNIPDNASRIAISYDKGSYGYGQFYVDDIKIYPTPSCVEPTGVAGSNMTANSAEISWTNGGSETSWKLQYTTVNPASATDGDWTNANSGNSFTTKPFTLNGLNASTTYYARVKADCGGGDLSDWSEASAAFTTECADITSLPWTENFNDKTVDALPLCWSAAGNTSAVGVKASSSYITLNSKALYFTGGSGTDVYVLLPEFEADLSTLQIEFSHVEEDATKSGKIEVGYYKNSSFTSLRACDYSASSSAWRTESAVVFPSEANGAKIAFHYKPNTSAYTAAIDNITVSVAPSCAVPTGFGASGITANTATVTWAAGSASAWKLQYKAEGGSWSAEQSVATTPSFELSSLSENTRYYVRVKADCGGGDVSEYSDGTFSFITECDAKTVTALVDWTEDFESQTADAMPSCWKRISNADEVVVSATSGNTAALCLKFKGKNPLVAMPEMNADVKDLKVTLSANCGYNTASYYGQIAVGYVVGSDFTEVDRVSKVESTYETKTVEMPNDAPTTARLALKTVDGSYTTTIYIDDITVSLKPNCPAPTGLTAVATSDGANISWTDDAASEWSLRYSVKDADSWTTIDNIAATNRTLTGLTVGTTYEVQVKAVCGVGSESAWTASAEFQPVCNAPTALAVTARTQTSATFSWTSAESSWKLQYRAVTNPESEWSETNVTTKPFTLSGLSAGTTYQAQIQSACGSAFTDAVSFTTWCNVKDASELPINITSFSALPECWEATFKGEYSGVAGNKICFYGTEEQMLVLPAYDINLNQLSVTFTFTTSGATPEFGYIDEPNGAFHAFGSALTSGVELDLAAEAAAVKYIAVRYPGGSGDLSNIMISAVNIRRTPGCAKLDAPTVDPAITSAEISWTAGSESAWNLQYKLATASSWTDVTETVTNPFTLNNLAQGTSYKVRVQANCGGETGDWSDETDFTTNCAAISAIPFTEGFDAALSNCWDITDENTEYYAHSVFNGELRLPGGKTTSGHLVKLPEITASLANATMTITYKSTTGTNTAVPQVGYMNGENFEQLADLDKSNSFKTAYVPLAAANGHRLVLRYDDGTSEGNFDIDEIRISHVEIFTDVEDAENETRIDGLKNKTLDFVMERSLLRDGNYSTLCLPFSLSAAQLANEECPLHNFEIRAYERANVNLSANQVDIFLRTVNAIEAGQAYIVRYKQDPISERLANADFRDVTIANSSEPITNVFDDAGVRLIGVYDPYELQAEATNLYLSTDNTLYYPASAVKMKGFRAYFGVKNDGAAHTAIHRGARVVIGEGNGTPTDVDVIVIDTDAARKVLENGQIVIIRDGKRYSVMGQVIE